MALYKCIIIIIIITSIINNKCVIADNILDIDALTDEQEQVLNSISVEYGMRGMDYSEYVSASLFIVWFRHTLCEMWG